MAGSILQTAHSGNTLGVPHIILHDRYGRLEDSQHLGRRFASADGFQIAVQAPRLQTVGGVGKVQGYYWFVGPRDRPEMTSLGDSLRHVEQLLLDHVARSGQRAILIGEGEGGTIAILTAMTWPEKVASVFAIDARMPTNFDKIPIEWPQAAGLSVRLIGGQTAELASKLAEVGADVTLGT